MNSSCVLQAQPPESWGLKREKERLASRARLHHSHVGVPSLGFWGFRKISGHMFFSLLGLVG